MYTDEQVTKFANFGYPFVKGKTWNGRQVWKMDAGGCVIGMPQIVIEENGRLRKGTTEEAFAYLKFSHSKRDDNK